MLDEIEFDLEGARPLIDHVRRIKAELSSLELELERFEVERTTMSSISARRANEEGSRPLPLPGRSDGAFENTEILQELEALKTEVEVYRYNWSLLRSEIAAEQRSARTRPWQPWRR
ncbi:MAG: hypothetical protein DLM70_06980 [Chloroflexi bacterium]|nr:MAG: hypothetical protein DLM70_06980 [Chloroflexota bacterium]